MDGEPFEIEEDLDVVLGELDSQCFVTMDVRRVVIVALDGDVAVGVQLGVFPLPAVELDARQRLERDFLDLLEPLATRDAEAAVGLLIDALDAHHQRPIDLGDGGKSRAAEPEAKVAGEDFYQSLDHSLIPWAAHTSRNDGCGEVGG